MEDLEPVFITLTPATGPERQGYLRFVAARLDSPAAPATRIDPDVRDRCASTMYVWKDELIYYGPCDGTPAVRASLLCDDCGPVRVRVCVDHGMRISGDVEDANVPCLSKRQGTHKITAVLRLDLG